jgi:hypothetical protein
VYYIRKYPLPPHLRGGGEYWPMSFGRRKKCYKRKKKNVKKWRIDKK